MQDPDDGASNYCCLCGAPFVGLRDLQRGLPAGWLEEMYAFQLTNKLKYLPFLPVDEYQNLVSDDVFCFRYLRPREGGFYVGDIDGATVDHEFLLHKACWEIAERSFQTNDHIRSKAHLYLTLEDEYRQTRGSPDRDGNIIDDPLKFNWAHDYYGAAKFQEKLWYRHPHSRVFEADPYDIEQDVTQFILSHLQQLPPKTLNSPLAARIEVAGANLQSNLLEYIASPLKPADPSIPSYRYFNPGRPRFWLDYLLEGALLPWLWDLDRELCEAKEQEARDHGNLKWDWELLIRMLAQSDVFEPGGQMGKNVPLGLRNRRRIWRILSEMEVPEFDGDGDAE